MFRFVFIASLAISASACIQPAYQMPGHHSPLLRNEWSPLFAPYGDDAASAAKKDSDDSSKSHSKYSENAKQPDVREIMITEALKWYDKEEVSEGYGAYDLASILDTAIPNLGWRANKDLEDLVARAQKRGAYLTGGRSKPGDIVLFHNQRDANGNGELDDWLTGCGVIVDNMGPRIVVITRTGHRPKKIVAWPDGPATDRVNKREINSFIRIPHRSDPKGTEYLAGQLYAGHIDVDALAERD